MARQSHKPKARASADATPVEAPAAEEPKRSKFQLEPEAPRPPPKSAVAQLREFVRGFKFAPPVEFNDLQALHDRVRAKVRELGLDGAVEVEKRPRTGEVWCAVFLTGGPDPEVDEQVPVTAPDPSPAPAADG
jgi:hypothetical protein